MALAGLLQPPALALRRIGTGQGAAGGVAAAANAKPLALMIGRGQFNPWYGQALVPSDELQTERPESRQLVAMPRKKKRPAKNATRSYDWAAPGSSVD